MADARPTDTDVQLTDTPANADGAPETDASLAATAAFDDELGDYPDDDERSLGFGLNLSFQSRLTIGQTTTKLSVSAMTDYIEQVMHDAAEWDSFLMEPNASEDWR
jgi:hypothetical protein